MSNFSVRTSIDVGGVVRAKWIGVQILVAGVEGNLEIFDGRNGEKLKRLVGH